MSIAVTEPTSVFELQPLINGFRTLREWVRPGSRDTFSTYLEWAQARPFTDRMGLLKKVSEKVAEGDLTPQSLLVFVSSDAHPQIIREAVSAYLTHRPCYLVDEFGGVREILELVSAEETENRGAVLAAIVGLGDRRINAVARVVRRVLREEDIRNFSRNVPATMQAAHIEFCVEWLLQAYGDKRSKLTLTSLTCALMLVVLNDDNGLVESRQPGVGMVNCDPVCHAAFADYAPDIVRRLRKLKKGAAADYEIDKVITLWETHAQRLQQAA